MIVIGGGAIGLSVAWRCAQRGANVALVDARPGSGASSIAAGMLAPVTEVHYGEETLLRLNIASSELYPSFVAELEDASGTSVGYEASGTLIVARDSDDNAELDHVYDFQRSLGLKVERLSGSECRQLEPGLASRTRGGILAPDDHRIDPGALTQALVRACERMGVRFVSHHALEVIFGGAVVTDDSATLEGDRVVVAAGAHSARIKMPGDVSVPVRPVKGQLVNLRGREAIARHNVRGIDGYIVGRSDGRVVIGATMEERGFDDSVTGDAVYELLRTAFELVPGVLDLEFDGASAGLRPTTPDNAPLIGETGVKGLFLATGHFRNGILLVPITADAIAKLVTGEQVDEIAPFTPTRFAAGVA